MSYHTTKEGTRIRIADMEDSHLLNTIKFFIRKSKEGVVIRVGGGIDPDEMWYDEELLKGEDYLDHIGFGRYIFEAKRRGLAI